MAESKPAWLSIAGAFLLADPFVRLLSGPRVAVRLRHRDETHRLLMVESDEKSLLERLFTGAHPGV